MRPFVVGHVGGKCNERTGTPFNFLKLPTDIVFEIVLCRLRYKLSLRDLPEMYLLRGFEFTHEAVREWEERFAPLLGRAYPPETEGESRSTLICRRDLPESKRKVVLSVPCDRPGRQSGGFDA